MALADNMAGAEIGISALPEGDDISVAANLNHELRDEDILLSPEQFEEFETEVVEDPDFRKPRKNEFIQRHPDPNWTASVGTLDIGMDGLFVVKPTLVSSLIEHGLTHRKVYTLINRDGDMFFAPYKIPDRDGNLDKWNQSAHRILSEDWATNTWFKVMSQKKSGKYIARRAVKNDIPSPEWPNQKSFMEYLIDAVRDRFIDSMDHPVVKALLGAE